MLIKGISWDVDLEEGESLHEILEALQLPTEADVPDDVNRDDIADWLSDKYGFLVYGFLVYGFMIEK